MLVRSILQFSGSDGKIDQFWTVLSYDLYWCFKLESSVSELTL